MLCRGNSGNIQKVEPMKFLCDHMLVRLGRWLRAAGYDTRIAKPDDNDAWLISIAADENRLLVTRDKLMNGENHILFLKSNSVEACARELSKKASVNWLKAPFSRCLLCNTPFEIIQPSEAKDIPEDIKNTAPALWRCPSCRKTYWEGSHTQKMLRQLKSWNS